MDEKLRKLERDFAASGSLDDAEKVVRHKMKAGQLHNLSFNLLEVDRKTFKKKN